MSMVEHNKALTREFYDRMNQGDLGVLESHIAADFVDHDVSNPTGDRAGVQMFFDMVLTAFPDVHMAVEDIIAEGEMVAVRVTMTGTHRGEFMGLPPTGKPIRVTGVDILRIRDDQAVEHWGEFDNLGMMQQIGAIPMPEQMQAPAPQAAASA